MSKSGKFSTKLVPINEALSLQISYFDNGDGEVFENQDLTLHGAFDDARFCLFGNPLTPEQLRRVADDLEKGYAQAQASLRSKYAAAAKRAAKKGTAKKGTRKKGKKS